MPEKILFGDRYIGKGHPVYIIAEIGVNHEGDVETCAKMIEAAALAGADAIKLQTCPPDENYIKGTESYELFSNCQLSQDETARMFEYARSLKVDPFTTSPDPQTLEWVDKLNPAGHKISSGMMTNPVIIRETCKTGRSVLMSTGLANACDIDEAVGWVRDAAAIDRFALFQCTSLYPAEPKDMNIARIRTLAEAYRVPVGLSDHSKGIDAAMLSVAAGACMLEKHFTLDVNRSGYDHRLSLDAVDFRKMVDMVRLAEIYMGNPAIEFSEDIERNRKKFLRCLFARHELKAGDILKPEDIALKRPLPEMRGLDATYYDDVIGKKILTDLKADDPVKKEAVAGI